jgi:hypothetical protein
MLHLLHWFQSAATALFVHAASRRNPLALKLSQQQLQAVAQAAAAAASAAKYWMLQRFAKLRSHALLLGAVAML